MPRLFALVLFALGFVLGGRVFADGEDAKPAETKKLAVAVFDLRPVRGNQTDLSLLKEAAKLSSELRDVLGEQTEARVVPIAEVKQILGPVFRVTAFDCHENPTCLQPMMRKLAKRGIQRVVVGTYELSNNQVQLTLNGIETRTGAFTKVELFETARDGDLDRDAAGKKMLAVADVPAKGSEPLPSEPIDTGADTTDVLAPMPPPPPPPVPDRIQVLGWARSETAYGFHKQSDDVLAAPYNKVESREQLFLAARYQRGKQYEATASGLLEFDVFDHRTAYQTTVREMYVGGIWDGFALRIGNQRIAWGKGDAISPNDVVNPRDLRDPLLTDTELRRIPTFLVRADIESGAHALQLLFQPFFIPDGYDISGSNWSIIQPTTPESIRGLFRLINGLFDPTLHDPAQKLFAQTTLPTNPSGGARYTYTGHNFDVSLYYHFGYNTTPTVTINPQFAGAIAMVDWRTATPTTLGPVLGLLDMGISPYSAAFTRRHHVGFDGVTTVGPIAVKIDAAYENKAVYYQPDIESFVTGQAQGVLSLEYQTGEIGKLLLLEGVYTHLMHTPPELGLIGYKRDTYGAAMTARWTFFDVIEAELRAVYELEPRTIVLQPQIAYRRRSNGFTVAAGALYLHGDPISLGDYYSRNNSTYVTIKYPF